MATALDLVTSALKEIGILAASETAQAEDAADGLTRLNRFLDRLAADKLSIYSVVRTTATLTASQASFTVGPAGNVNMARPIFLDHVNFIDTSLDPDTEFQLPMLTEDAYAEIVLKAQTSTYPQAAYYSSTYPTGTLIPWPIPTSATLLWAVYAWTAVPQFAALSTSVSLPPSYEEMLVTNLALLLCPSYGVQPNPMLIKSATESLATLKRANRKLSDLGFELGAIIGSAAGGYYDIRQG